MIHEELCTYEVAKLAKEKGFPQDVDRWLGDLHSSTNSNYYNHKGELNGDCIEIVKCKIQKEETPKEFELVSAPTQSLLQRWLREEKKIHINICAAYGWKIERTDGNILLPHNNLDYICTHLRSSDVTWEDNYGCFDSYELALEDALKYALEKLV